MSQCIFTRRRFIKDTTPTITELLTDINVIQRNGRNNTATGTFYMANSYIPTTGLSYMFSICNGYMGIWKFKNGVITTTPVVKMDASYGGLHHRTATNYNYWYYLNGGYTTSTSDGGSAVYGGTLALVSFPSYTEAEIDKALSRVTYTRLTGENSSEQQNIRTNNLTNTYYLCASNAYFELWQSDGTTWTNFFKPYTSAQWTVSNSYLAKSSRAYGGTIIGLTSTV